MSSEAFREDGPGPRGFSVEVETHGETVVLNVVGEIDLVSAPVLEESITTALERRPNKLVVDLSEVGFLASVGMSVLIGCNEQAGDTTQFRLVATGASTFRPMELTGVADTIAIFPTRGQALTED